MVKVVDGYYGYILWLLSLWLLYGNYGKTITKIIMTPLTDSCGFVCEFIKGTGESSSVAFPDLSGAGCVI